MRLYPAIRISIPDSWPEDRIEELIAALDDFHPTAVEEQPGAVRVFFGSVSARDAALAYCSSDSTLSCRAEDVPDEGWAERSQASLGPVTIDRLTIAPPWAATDALRAEAPGRVIVIQPSMGFGTGHHASTRLCLRWLQQVSVAGKRVLDVGTGSGVLAIAARVLGASRVVGLDIDPDALANARENLALNGLEHAVALEESDARAHAAGHPHGYDVVLANLTGGLLLREAQALGALVAPGGCLIVSGIQPHEIDVIEAAFAPAGWRASGRLEEAGWIGELLISGDPGPD